MLAVNGTGMLGWASSKCGAMSSVMRWKRLICPHGVRHVPKSAVSASTAAESAASRSAGAARDDAMYCITEIPDARASVATRRPARSPQKTASDVGTDSAPQRYAHARKAATGPDSLVGIGLGG